MLINKHKSWPRLLSELKNKKSIFNQPCGNELAKCTLVSVVTVAKMIATRAPEIIQKDNVRICIAGVETHDVINGGEIFNLLPLLLNESINYQVDLIGDKIDNNLINHNNSEIKVKSDSVSITKSNCLLGAYLSENTPDIVIILHPGFEEYHKSWMVDDNGLEIAMLKEIKVLGASYGDEAPIDKLYANSHGYNVCKIQKNPFQRAFDEVPVPSYVSSDIFSWAAQTWELEKISNENNETISDLIPFLVELISTRAATEIIPVSGYYTKNMTLNNSQWFNIIGDLYISFQNGLIIDSSEEIVVCEDVEIDVSDIEQYKEFKFLFLSLKCALAYREFIKPMMTQLEESKSASIFSESDVSAATRIAQETGNHSGLREMNSSEKSIENDFKVYDGSDLVTRLKNNYSTDELTSFRNDQKYNLLHIGCAIDDIEIIALAKSLGLNPDQRNSDMYSPLDLCVADGGIDGLKMLIKLYPEIDMNAAGAWGFTALHHTKTRRKPDMAMILKNHGAKDTIKNAAGLAYKDM